MDISGQIHALTALPTGKRPWNPLNMKLVGHQSRCERFGKEEHFLLLPDYEPWIFQPIA
jgi:hypothetical protein